MKRIDFVRHLEHHNCVLVREGGNHGIYRNTGNGKISAVGRHRELDKAMCKIMCKQLEIPFPE